ncbi:MAG TPA: hypothetical protein VMS64_29905 [Candidatus Methylomirabilis sp.]|nr:hypothetical protein [Candidatus Methylomirabilis sp.]
MSAHGDRLEDRLRIPGGPADGPEDLGGGGLPRVGLCQGLPMFLALAYGVLGAFLAPRELPFQPP